MRIVHLNARSTVQPQGVYFLLGRRSAENHKVCRENDPNCYEFLATRITNKHTLISKRRLERQMDVFVPQQSLLTFPTPTSAKSFVKQLRKHGHFYVPRLDLINYNELEQTLDLELQKSNQYSISELLACKVEEDDMAELCTDLVHNLFVIHEHKWTDSEHIVCKGEMEEHVFPIELFADRLVEETYEYDEIDYNLYGESDDSDDEWHMI